MLFVLFPSSVLFTSLLLFEVVAVLLFVILLVELAWLMLYEEF